jgi:NitT/TauT family transport system permease protein
MNMRSMNMRWLMRSPLLGLIGLALLWGLAAPALKVNPRYLPPLGLVVADALATWRDLLASLWRTSEETLLGFVSGGVLGVGCGVGFAYARWLERGMFPLFVALQNVPVIAFGAIVVIWFGNGLAAKVVIALYLALFPVAVNTLRGLQDADPERVALLRSFGASPTQIFFKLMLPSALPSIMVGLKVGVSLALAGAIVGEWFGDTVGLGVMLLQALYFEQIARVWVVIVICGGLGAALYGALGLVERRFVWWRTA